MNATFHHYFASLPWSFGANFTPSNAINQLEMWQEETFSPELIDRELGFAERIGMTLMRVYLHDLAYQQDSKGFFDRVEKYLAIAERHHIHTVFVFFDDCWLPNPAIGPQPAPKPCVHNSGWVQSPGEEVLALPEEWPRLKLYVQDVLKHFGKDSRILLWDLYNEPHPFPRAIQGATRFRNELLEQVFAWARETAPSQPLTVDIWTFDKVYDEINRFALDNSDVVSFHNYEEPTLLARTIDMMRFLANGRPVICTEYMARTRGSNFAECLPLLKAACIPAINWGLVSGKTNTIYPYGWDAAQGVPPQWFHDVFNADGTLLYPEEEAVFSSI